MWLFWVRIVNVFSPGFEAGELRKAARLLKTERECRALEKETHQRIATAFAEALEAHQGRYRVDFAENITYAEALKTKANQQ